MNYITLQDSYQFREDYAIINKIKRVSGLSEIRNAVPQFLKLVDEAINKVGGEKYMIVLLKIGLALYGVIYAVLKRLPVQKKIVFMSRQSNEPSLDIRMTADEIIEDFVIYVLYKCHLPAPVYQKSFKQLHKDRTDSLYV